MTTANIPLDKTATIKPFFMEHSKNGGALTSANNLQDRYLPPVNAKHFAVVKEKLEGKPVSVIIDETTDERDKSVMNVLVGQLDKLYLIDVVFMDACNQQTVAQATLRSLPSAGNDYNNVCVLLRTTQHIVKLHIITSSKMYSQTAFMLDVWHTF